MNGFVDGAGRALIDVELKPEVDAAALTMTAWIDTGFTGDLVLPRTLIENLMLPQSGTVGAVLADGSKVAMSIYTCFINWFDQQQQMQVVANDGAYPLLGVGLLQNRELRIDYRAKVISLE